MSDMDTQQNGGAAPASTAVTVLEPMAVQSPQNISPVRPAFLDDAAEATLQEQAGAIVKAVLENPNSVKVTAGVYGIGSEYMGQNTGHVQLMEAKIGEVMKQIGEGNPVAKSLVQIKTELDTVNPAVVGQTEISVPKKVLFGLLTRTARYIPKGDQVLTVINERRDTVATTIDGLKRHLWEGRDQALRNALELGQIGDQLFATQRQLQEAAYVGQIVWQKLNEALATETDAVRRQALTTLVNDLAMQVVDIQTVDTLNVQSRLAAEALIGNSNKLVQGVRRVTDVLLPAVAVNLGVKAAAAQQLQVMDAMAQITRAAEQTIVDTAAQTRQAAVRMEKMQTEALVDPARLQSACDELVQMVGELEGIRAAAEQKARETSTTLSTLADTMRKVTDPMTERRQAKAAAAAGDKEEQS